MDICKILAKATKKNENRYKKAQFYIDIPTEKELNNALEYYGQNKSSFIRKAIKYFLYSLKKKLTELNEE